MASKRLLVAVFIAGFGTLAAGQVPDLLLIPQAEARSHLTASPQPSYPMLAGAAGVRGPVHFEVDVSADGRVTATRVMHGSPMLEQAATDAMARWRFSPIHRGGQAVAYRTSMMVTFAGSTLDANLSSGMTAFGDALLLCTDASRRRAFISAEKRCHLAGQIADRFTTSDLLLPSRPRRLQAEALVELGQTAAAIRLFEQIEIRLRSQPYFSLDRTMALRGLGRTYAAAGRADDAMRVYGQADRQLHEAYNGAGRNTSFKAEVAGYIRSITPDYVTLLERAGRTADATRVRTRAEAIR
jgi:TonB family protein